MTLILGIETSCDETAAAVVEHGRRVRSDVVATQHDLHRRYGGVVPEIASRAHLERITPVVEEALSLAGIGFDQIDAVAVGNRPGLIGSLIVGVSAAKAIAWSLGKPLIGVDHILAHLHAAALWVDPGGDDSLQASNMPDPPQYPAVGLVVSGGHTTLYRVGSPVDAERLGSTIDDAVGEAYDKAAVVLGLEYPGGPNLDRLAAKGDPTAVDLPRSLLGKESLDFSFSGLKTALLYAVRGRPVSRKGKAEFPRSAADLDPQAIADFAASFQAAAVDAVMIKLERAINRLTLDGAPPRSLIVGGGVTANSLLRTRVRESGETRGLPVHLPPMRFCVDNAAMIAGLAYEQFARGSVDDLALPAIATASR